MTTPAIVVSSTLAQERMDRLRGLFGQIEREFGDLIEENAELRKQLIDRGIPVPPPKGVEHRDRSKSWVEHKGNYLTQLKSRITTQTPIEKKEWKFLREFLGHRDGVYEVSVARQVEHLLGSASLDRTARVWTADDSAPTVVYVGHRGAVNSIRFHPRESLAVTASGDGSCHIWRHSSSDAESRAPMRPPVSGPTAAEPWTPLLGPPRMLEPQSVGGGSAPVLGTTPPPVRRNDILQRSLEAIAPEPSSEVIYAIPVRAPLQRLRGHTQPVSAADWLSTGDQVASGGSDNVVRIWSAETGATVAQVPAGSEEGSFITNITTLSISTVLAASCADGYFRVYDVRTLGKPLYESRSVILSLRFPDMVLTWLSSATHAVLAHEGVVSTAVIATNGSTLVTGSDDKMVKVWDLRKDKTPVYTHRCSAAINRLSVSPSGASIAVPLDNRHTKICELMGSRVGQLNSHEPEGHRMAITSAVWSADESIVYTSSFDRYRSVLAWSFSESKEDQREAREAAAMAKKSASAADRKAKREQKETKDAIRKQEKEAREVARKEQRERERKEEQERELQKKLKEEKKPLGRSPSGAGPELFAGDARAPPKEKDDKKKEKKEKATDKKP